MNNDFVKVYNKVIGEDLCKQLIAMFEENPQQHEDIKLEGHRSFKQVTLQQHNDWQPFTEKLTEVFFEHIDKYRQDCNITNGMFPEQFAFEQYRMKKYEANDFDEFKDHVDVQSHAGAKRYLIMMAYLNEDFDEGETQFPHHSISIPPKTGSILIFPPLWTHLHRGRPPINGTAKYITMTYLNYTDMTKVDYNKNPLLGESYREGHGSMAAKENE